MVSLALVEVGGQTLRAQNNEPSASIAITKTAGSITVDAELSDPGWQGATRVDTFYETNPGDNLPAKVRSVAYLTYDQQFFYAAFEFSDPEPSKIRAPLGDRDNVPSYTDYGGVILDTRHDGKTGLLLLANPHGVQYDAITDDVTGNEDSAPDFFWDSVARITEVGWILELRVPFSSLRYDDVNPQTWGILLYRNYPRDFRYQMFSAKLPRGGNCLICFSNPLAGFTDLPTGGHLVVAPFMTASQTAHPTGDLGTALQNDPFDAEAGLDTKWTPNADHALDLTLNPDFSQVESDVAQIASNERFALFFPEKRPFFLEGIELFSTPIQAVYTRTITAPSWGGRATGKFGSTAYTALIADDRGGGSVILPGANSSDLADQDFSSLVAIGRLRHDLGRSFISLLATDREISGGGYNRVFGPDFQWRPGDRDIVTGQLLFSQTETPNRPDLADPWTGQQLSSHAADAYWSHTTRTVDWFGEYKDFGADFRADDGFVPQVGYRQFYGETGYTFRPSGPLSRVRTFFISNYSADTGGDLLTREISPGIGMDGRWNLFTRLRYSADRVRSGDQTFPRQRFIYYTQFSPSRAISQIEIEGRLGSEVDFDNSRRGFGSSITLTATIRPTDHLELQFNGGRRTLDVDTSDGHRERLFTAQVARLRLVYTFTARTFVRLITQYVATKRDVSLYDSEVDQHSGSFSSSALFAYKLNWQTVLFLGYGDTRTMTPEGQLERDDRQLFFKLSYAFQR
jgi:hypothetical protein